MSVLAAVVEEGGFGRAAEKLGVSQSAVSQTIAGLEHRLDTPLVVRGKAGALTEAGIRLYRFARTLLMEEERALQDIRGIKSGALSTLNLAMNSMVNRFHGRDLLLAFCEANPLTRLKLDVVPSQEIIYGVDADRWELGFGPFHAQMPGHFEVKPYFHEDRYLVVHRAHPLADQLLADAARVLGQVTLLTSYLDEAPRRGDSPRIREHFADVWELSNLELRLALAQAGKGVTYLSDRFLDVYDGFVRVPGLDISAIARDVGLFFKKHKPLSEAARRFKALAERRFLSPES